MQIVPFRLALVLTGAALLGGGGIACSTPAPPTPEAVLAEARASLERGDPAEAERLSAPLLDNDRHVLTATEVAAQAAEQQGRVREAADYLVRGSRRAADLADADTRRRAELHLRAGVLLASRLHQASAAEQQFRAALQLMPDLPQAHDNLSFVLGLTARSWEAIPHRLQLLKQNQAGPIHLFLLCMGDTALENTEDLAAFQAAAPNDPAVLVGLARAAVDRQAYADAERYLTQAIRLAPHLVEAHVKLGSLIVAGQSATRFEDWSERLPAGSESHPGIWIVRATRAQSANRTDEAIRALWEAVRLDPNQERGNYQLSQLLIARGDGPRAQPFLERSRLLSEYFDVVKVAYLGEDGGLILKAARLAERLENLWEAAGWYHGLLAKGVAVDDARRSLSRIAPRLAGRPLERTLPGSNPAQTIDLSDFPLPAEVTPPAGPESRPASTGQNIAVAFVDEARQTGLEFQYVNGAPLGVTEHRMYEFTGGGVGVLDYDRDGWPDLYLTQGTAWPPGARQDVEQDGLFRMRGGRFTDIARAAGIQEAGFGQGVTVGDFNDDGFPDLYVANIGRNALWRNNGDGSFTEVTEAAGVGGDAAWSTSCALVDLNQDGFPDLYCVNYVTGDDVFTRLCPDGTGKPRSCSPRHFAAAQDRLWLNQGDGRFEDITETSGIVVPDGKGLGIVAADFDGSGRISLFIANDAVPNFLFVNPNPQPGTMPRYEEQALIAGLALNADGRPQACMGVGCGDLDGDGQLDLFVTNFFDEYNTVYRQVHPLQFEDATRGVGLFDASLKKVGFGTQFIDAERDGRLDIVLVNGDVDDFRDLGREYAMQPQFLRNGGHGRFELVAPAEGSPGPYFQQKQLGRAMARLDWNRDGREDVAISNLDVPTALLTNATAPVLAAVSIRLSGVASSRDAIGTTLTADIAGRRIVRQLTGGDGYQASNERLLVFGLGDARQIDQLEVRWPSGRTQQFSSFPAHTEWLLIESAEVPLPLTSSGGEAASESPAN